MSSGDQKQNPFSFTHVLIITENAYDCSTLTWQSLTTGDIDNSCLNFLYTQNQSDTSSQRVQLSWPQLTCIHSMSHLTVIHQLKVYGKNYQALANVSFDLGLLQEPRSAKHISKCLNPSSFSKAVKQCLTIMVPLCLCALLNQGPNAEILVTSLNNIIFMNPFRNESNVTGSGINTGINTFFNITILSALS